MSTVKPLIIDCQSHLFCPDHLALMEKRTQDPVVRVKDGARYVIMGDWHRKILANHSDPAALLADMDANGIGRFVPATTASGGLATVVPLNCAPALSADERTLYVGMRGGVTSGAWLVALRTEDLSTQHVGALVDPLSLAPPFLGDNGTASPMVAPDGHIYYGVLENPFGANAVRGWMMQTDSLLVSSGPPAGKGTMK